MSEIICTGAIEADGTRICDLHREPLIDREIAELRGFTKGTPNLGAQWFCPVSGSAIGEFGEPDGYLNQIISAI